MTKAWRTKNPHLGVHSIVGVVCGCLCGPLHCRFADFLREQEEDESGEYLPVQKVYEPVPNIQLVRTRAMEYLQRFNEEDPAKAANLVLFDDALAHLMIISRIIQVMSPAQLLVEHCARQGKQSRKIL